MPEKLLPVIYYLLAGYLLAICRLFDTACQLWVLYIFLLMVVFIEKCVWLRMFPATMNSFWVKLFFREGSW